MPTRQFKASGNALSQIITGSQYRERGYRRSKPYRHPVDVYDQDPQYKGYRKANPRS